MEDIVDRSVDQSNAVLLALGNSHVEVFATAIGIDMGAIDQKVVGCGWARMLCNLIQRQGWRVVPISER